MNACSLFRGFSATRRLWYGVSISSLFLACSFFRGYFGSILLSLLYFLHVLCFMVFFASIFLSRLFLDCSLFRGFISFFLDSCINASVVSFT